MIKSHDKFQDKVQEEIEAIASYEAHFNANLSSVKLPEIPAKYKKIITDRTKKYSHEDDSLAFDFRSAHENEEISIFKIGNLYENFEIPTRKLNIDMALKYYEFNIAQHDHFESLWRYFYVNYANYENRPDKQIIGHMCAIALKIFSCDQYTSSSKSSYIKESISIYRKTFKILLNFLKINDERNDDNAARKEAIKWYIINLLNAAKDAPFNDDEFKEMVSNANFLRTNNHLKFVVAKTKIDSGGDFKPGIYSILNKEVGLTSTPDPEHVKAILDTEFPWFTEANEFIYRQLIVKQLSKNNVFKIRPLLLVGPPGVGKTSWGLRLAELSNNTPFLPLSVAGNADSMTLRGVPRGYSTARPGMVAHTVAMNEIGNVLVMIDEIDKTERSWRGSILDALLQLIEPSSAKQYFDECLQVSLDLSNCSYIATANELGVLTKPLLERFAIVHIQKPGDEYFQAILNKSLSKIAANIDIDVRMLPEINFDDIEILKSCKSPREINRTAEIMIEMKFLDERKLLKH